MVAAALLERRGIRTPSRTPRWHPEMRSRDALRPGGQSVGDWTEKKTPKNIADLYFPVALLVKTLKLPRF